VDEVKKIIEIAKQVFLQDGYHVPMVFIKGDKGKVVVEMKSFGSTSYQRELDMLKLCTDVACEHNVGDLELVVLVSEAWASRTMQTLPSRDPKRIEILSINFLNVGSKEEKATIFQVIRDRWGKAIELRPYDESTDFFEVKGHLLPAFVRGYTVISPVHN
jgi:hypothetical protein